MTNPHPSPDRVEELVDPRTKRPFGDNGTAGQALEYALDHMDNYADMDVFLRAWREGDLDEWPEFYTWLAKLSHGSVGPHD
jgi:hypothetical protein